jgi:uncharacterized membrane protein (UPF0136 family)
MFKLLLISIVIVPVLLAMHAARGRASRRGVPLLLALVLGYDLLYWLMLYYLRLRWVGFGPDAG